MRKLLLLLFIASLSSYTKAEFNKYFEMDLLTADYMSMCLANEDEVYPAVGNISYKTGRCWI